MGIYKVKEDYANSPFIFIYTFTKRQYNWKNSAHILSPLFYETLCIKWYKYPVHALRTWYISRIPISTEIPGTSIRLSSFV